MQSEKRSGLLMVGHGLLVVVCERWRGDGVLELREALVLPKALAEGRDARTAHELVAVETVSKGVETKC